MKGIAVDIVFAQQSLQRSAVFAGGFGGVAYIATMGCEQSGEIIAFKITHGCRLGLAQALRFWEFHGVWQRNVDVFRLEHRLRTEHHASLNYCFQLSYVSRP